MRRADLDKLQKVCGLFGSDHAGERSAAALHAHRLVTNRLGGWNTLLTPLAPNAMTKHSPEPVWPSSDHRTIAARLLSNSTRLTAWELNFVQSVGGYRSLTEAQWRTLMAIDRSVREKEARHGRAA